ncbi:MAG TPA: alpha/beta fold hydrolase, partial [Candidatus Microbacterium pullistercoris]|nr:alpha/beta fold hydrolase [Candidatus Microbacterium pullistercoris]
MSRGARGVLTGERHITVDEYTLNVAEGPDNGPPLVLLHGQAARWQDHRRVLPDLVVRYRVIAIDVPGHGGSDDLPADEYTCVGVAALLAAAIEQVTDDPVL